MSLQMRYVESTAAAAGAYAGSCILSRFGARVRQMRRERELSDCDLAWQIGITRAHLQDIEEGAEQVDLGLLTQISGALGVSLSMAVHGL